MSGGDEACRHLKKKRGGRKCKRYVIERIQTLIFNLESRNPETPTALPSNVQLCWVEKQEPAFVFVFLMMESNVLGVGDTAVFTVVQTAQEPSTKYCGRPLGGRPLSRQREAVVIMDPLYGWSKTTSTQPGSPPDCKAAEACEASQKSS